VVHYLWLVKKDITLPVLYGLVLAVLLGIRFAWRRRVPAVQAAVSRPPG